MNYLGKYYQRNVYTILFDEYYNLFQKGQIDPGVYYVITNDDNKMILSGEIVGRVVGNEVFEHSTNIRYEKVFERMQKDKHKSYSAFINEVKDKEVKQEEAKEEDRGIEVQEIIFANYSGVVDKFFEELKNVKYDV